MYKPTKLEPARLLLKDKKIPIKCYFDNVQIKPIVNGGARISLGKEYSNYIAIVFITEKKVVVK